MIKTKGKSMVCVFLIIGLVLFFGGQVTAGQYTYNNHATVTAYGNNIFGWHMAWVTSSWTFATMPSGQFLTDRDDTFYEAYSGGHWPDGGSWGYIRSSESQTTLAFIGNFELHSPFNSISGTLYNNVVYHPWDHTYSWYRGVRGVSLQWQDLPLPPIEIEVDV